MLNVTIKTSDDMINLGKIFGKILLPNDCLALSGELGAGKTTFTKGIGLALNIKQVINSPTFTIMKIYEGDKTLYHLDVYRIQNAMSDFDLEEYFYLGGITVIEWAENIKELLPPKTIKLTFTINPDTSRNIQIEAGVEFLQKLEAYI